MKQIPLMKMLTVLLIGMLVALISGTVMSGSSTSVPTSLPHPVKLVRQDLAERLRVASSSIEVVQMKEVVWPDTCLGLPAPELCAPGETPGYQVILRVLKQEYRYHTDRGETFRFAGPGDVPQRP